MDVKESESSVKKKRNGYEGVGKKTKKPSEMYHKPFGFKKGSCIL